jgi:hypothetical protein
MTVYTAVKTNPPIMARYQTLSPSCLSLSCNYVATYCDCTAAGTDEGMSVKHQCTNIDRGKVNVLSQCHFVHHKSHID